MKPGKNPMAHAYCQFSRDRACRQLQWAGKMEHRIHGKHGRCISQDQVTHLRGKEAIDEDSEINAVTFEARRMSRASGMYAAACMPSTEGAGLV